MAATVAVAIGESGSNHRSRDDSRPPIRIDTLLGQHVFLEIVMSKVFVAGGTGQTGHLLIQQLLKRGHHVVTVVRSISRLRELMGDFDEAACTMTEGNLLDLTDQQLIAQVDGCHAIASCLGHNLTLKGMYGQPRRLVTNAAERLCKAAQKSSAPKPVRFVLMSSSGVRNHRLNETHSIAERCAFALLRTLVPPHVDNEQAAEFLQTQINEGDPGIEWSIVRPDSLHDADEVTEYDLEPSPVRSPLFNSGKSSRINVAHLMAELISDDETWNRWKGKTPVLYNRD